METGFRVDAGSGRRVPAHCITHVDCAHNGKVVLHCNWSRAVAKTPILSLILEGARAGDTLALHRVDNKGEEDRLSLSIIGT